MMLPLAAERAHEDVEYVHQLRVATRRSGAALRIFAPCLRSGPLRKTKKRLRRLRRAAGTARECDVHRELLLVDRKAQQGPVAGVLEEVLGRLADERRRAQETIKDAAERYPVKKLRRGRRKLIGSLHNPEAPRDRSDVYLADAARDVLPELIEALRASGTADLKVVENLHQMRITGKRLRYALEIFAPCFDDRFRDAYGNIEALQEHLGAINDSHELLARVEGFAESAGPRPEVAQTIDFYLRQRGERVDRFVAEWSGGMGDRLFSAQRDLVTALNHSGAGEKS
jgi:CHAD domain-containing protein